MKVMVRFPSVVLWIAVSALALQACSDQKEGTAHASGKTGRPAMPVATLHVVAQNIPVTLEAIGQAEGSKTVEVRARVTGIVEKILFTEGRMIKAGDAMFKLEPAELKITLSQAQSAANQAKAVLEQARRQRDRIKKLHARKLVSRSEFDAAIASASTSSAAYQVAQAKVADAKLKLSYAQISAPISGYSSRALASQGSLVKSGSTTPLTTIVATDPIWVRFGFSEAQLGQLGDPGAAVVSLLDSNGDVLVNSGRLNFVAPTIDPKLGTVTMRAEFANPDRAVLPGQFVQVHVQTGERSAFLVPQTAISQNAKGSLVWLVNADSKAESRPVTTAEWRGTDWVIEAGIVAGDEVILNNLMKLRPGAAVSATPRKQ